MAIKLQIRRDTLTNWNANSSVVLLEGEIGYVTDTRNMKIGDGTTIWSSLKYQAPYYTAANTGAANTVLSVDAGNGRVGIGNASPASTLDVTGQVRVRGTTAYSAPADNVAAINYDSTSGVMTVDARSNAGSTVIAVHTSNATAGAERLRISSAGNVGIGTTSPQDQVHIEGTGPVIRLKDTTSTTAEYATIDANTSTGSISINANQGNLAGVQASALVALKVNGTERLRANDSGLQISGTTSVSGLITANGGLTIPTGDTLTVDTGGTIAFPTGANRILSGASITDNSIALSSIVNQTGPVVLGRVTASSGVMSALTSGLGGTAQTALGLGSAAYTNGSDFICALNQVGQIAFVTFGDNGSGTDAGVYTGVTSTSTSGPNGGANTVAPTYVSFGGTTTWSKPGSGTRYVRPNQGTWTCIQTNNSVASTTTQLSMICIRTA